MHRWMKKLSGVTLIVIIFLLTVNLSVGAVSDLEKEIAKNNLKTIKKEYGFAKLDSKEEKEIRNIFNKLAAKAKYDAPDLNFKFYIIDADIINALYMGDGRLAVFKGLVNGVENNKQLAAIIAHELGHGVNDDIQDNIDLIRNLQLGGALIDLVKDGKINQDTPDTATSIAMNLLYNGYSRKQEKEADEYSVILTNRAGYDPYCTVEVMELLKKEQGGGSSSELLEVFSTHPNLDNRINYLKGFINKVKQAEKLYGYPVSTAQRFALGLLTSDFEMIYATTSDLIQEQLSLQEVKEDPDIRKIRSKLKKMNFKNKKLKKSITYNIELRNQVERTARVAISFTPKKRQESSSSFSIAVDLIKEKYGWKVLRGPFIY